MTMIATVIIGRNEGARLVACLASIDPGLGEVIYVDSGSSDGSVAAAESVGAQVVTLNTDVPFTAARARNAGVAALIQPHDVVQFIDGDSTLDPGWLEGAKTFMENHPEVAVVCGRLRERHPDHSVYNRLCDFEWDTPVGEAKACGGNAMMRLRAFTEVGGFNPGLIAGEEPELCLRLRAAGWRIWRIDAEMALHDAAMMRFSQFWKRARRSGYASAQGAAMHGARPERHGVAGTRRALLWGLVLPILIVVLALILGPLALILGMIYPVQVTRLALRDGADGSAWERAFLLTVGKFAEGFGVVEYHMQRRSGRAAQLIEYK